MQRTARHTQGMGAQMTRTAASGPRKDIKNVWLAYKKTPTQKIRNILMENYLHLVR